MTGVRLVGQPVYGFESSAQRGRAPHNPDTVPHLLPHGAAHRSIAAWSIARLHRALRKRPEILLGAGPQGRRGRGRVGEHRRGGMFPGALAKHIALWESIIRQAIGAVTPASHLAHSEQTGERGGP